MRSRARIPRPVGLAVAVCLLGSGCGGVGTRPAPTRPPGSGIPATASPSPGSAAPVPSQAPVPAERNPPGDIPDNQTFVAYTSATGGFALKVPEGWARAQWPGSVSFTDHLNTIEVSWAPAAPPTVERAKAVDLAGWERSRPAFRLRQVAAVSLPAGPAVHVVAQENSPPNPVTGKRYRLDVERLELGHGGRTAVLLLSSPVGADNIDPWRLVSESFRWR